jgi:replicative DNA helicase
VFAGGLKGSVAVCGTAFTGEHVEMALAHGITRIVLVFDPDQGGEKGTQRAIDMLEQFGNHPGLTVEIVTMPEGTEDPDAYVRAFGDLRTGVNEFRKMPRTDLFTWKLTKAIEEGADPIQICDETVPLIINQPNDLFRLQMADRLSLATGVPQEFVRREVLRRIDETESRVDEERNLIAQETARSLAKDPRNFETIIAAAQSRIEVLEERKVGYDPTIPLKHLHATFDKMESSTDPFELLTGYTIFDQMMGGIPREGVMISMPGKPHHGKSIFLDNLVIGMLKLNSNVQIMLHHVDDAALLRVPRLLGVMSGLSSRSMAKAGSSLAAPGSEEFEARYSQAKEQLLAWQTEERLILADQSVLNADLPSLERWVKQIRRRHPDRHLVVIGDNFHLFDMPGMEAGENKVREMSKFIAGMPTKHNLTTIFTMELPKDVLKAGVRPKYTDSKNSGGISFDSKVNINIYQELQDIEDSEMVWKDSNFMEKMIGPGGEELVCERPMPIVEVIVDKNKVTGEKKTIMYKLEPMSGRMEECSDPEQLLYRDTLTESKKNRKSQGSSYAENRRSI